MKAELTLPERPTIVHLLAVADILVLLLVFFILITNVARETGVSVVSLPEGEYRLRQYGPKVVVTARGGTIPTIYVGLDRVPLEDLEPALRKAADEAGAETVLLLADRMLPVAVERKIIEVGRKLELSVMLVGSRSADESPDLPPDPRPPVPAPEER